MNNVKKIRKITLFSSILSLLITFSLFAMKKSEPTPIPKIKQKALPLPPTLTTSPVITFSTSPVIHPQPLRSSNSSHFLENQRLPWFENKITEEESIKKELSNISENKQSLPTTFKTPSPTKSSRNTPRTPGTPGTPTCFTPSQESRHARHPSLNCSFNNSCNSTRCSWDSGRKATECNSNLFKTPEEVKNEKIINILKKQDVEQYEFIVKALNEEGCPTKKAELLKLIFDNICLTTGEKPKIKFRLCSNINKKLVVLLKEEQESLKSFLSSECDFNNIVFIDDNHIKNLGYYTSFGEKGKEMLGGGHCWKEYGLPEIIEGKTSSCCLLKFCPSVENHCTGVCCGNWLYHDRINRLIKIKSSTLFPWHAKETYKVWECIESAFNNAKKKEVFSQGCKGGCKIHFLSSYSYYKVLGGNNVKIRLVLRCGYNDSNKTYEILSAYPLGAYYLNLKKITKKDILESSIPYHSVRFSEKLVQEMRCKRNSVSPERFFEELSLFELTKEALVTIKQNSKNVLHRYTCRRPENCTCSIVPIRNNIVVDDAIVLKIHHSDFIDTEEGFKVSVTCKDGSGLLSFSNSNVTPTTTPSPSTTPTCLSEINCTCKNLEEYLNILGVFMEPLKAFRKNIDRKKNLNSLDNTNKQKLFMLRVLFKNIESMINLLERDILPIHNRSILSNGELNKYFSRILELLNFIKEKLNPFLDLKGKALNVEPLNKLFKDNKIFEEIEYSNFIEEINLNMNGIEELLNGLTMLICNVISSYSLCH